MATINLYHKTVKKDTYYIGVSDSDSYNGYRTYYKISDISTKNEIITNITLEASLRVTNQGDSVTADYNVRIYTDEDDAIALNNNYKSQQTILNLKVEATAKLYTFNFSNLNISLASNQSLYIIFMISDRAEGEYRLIELCQTVNNRPSPTIEIGTLSSTANIFINNEWQPHTIHIHNGTTWNQYIPYIYNGTEWVAYT